MILSSITQTWRCGDAGCKTPPVVHEVHGPMLDGLPTGWIELQGKGYCSTLCAMRMLRLWRSFERKEAAAEKRRKKASAGR